MVTISFVAGTVEVRGLPEAAPAWLPAACRWDPRTACHRAPAIAYADLLRAVVREKVEYSDGARRYDTLDDGARVHREPRIYQSEALDACPKQAARQCAGWWCSHERCRGWESPAPNTPASHSGSLGATGSAPRASGRL